MVSFQFCNFYAKQIFSFIQNHDVSKPADSASQESNIQWQAARASGSWFDVVLKSLSSIHDFETIGRFTTVATGESVVPEDFGDSPSKEWLRMEKSRLETYFALLVECGSARCWSQMLFVTCQPNSLAAVLHEHRATAQSVLNKSKAMWEGILKAEAYVQKTGRDINKVHQSAVKKFLGFVCWNQMQISRECFLECEKAHWNAESQNLKDLARVMFGGPCQTKFDLEDLFAHLVKVSTASNKPTAMNKILVWVEQVLSSFWVCP